MDQSHADKTELDVIKNKDVTMDLHVRVAWPRCHSNPNRKRLSLSCDRSNKTDLASAPLIRAVVTNSDTCLNHRASASFTVHHGARENTVHSSMVATACGESELSARDAAQAPPPLVNSEDDPDTPLSLASSKYASRESGDEHGKGMAPIVADPAAVEEATAALHREHDGTVSVSEPPYQPMTVSGVSCSRSSPEGCENQPDGEKPLGLPQEAELTETQPKPTASESRLSWNLSRSVTAGPANLGEIPLHPSRLETRSETPSEKSLDAVVIGDQQEVVRPESREAMSITSLRSRGGATTPLSIVHQRPVTPSDQLRSTSESAVSNIQYRAVTVCAAGVALALFIIVMRRLSLMLHGV